MRYSLIFVFTVIFFGCNRNLDLNGHWHLEREHDHSGNPVLMDIISDSIVYLGLNSLYGENKGEHNIDEKRLFFPGECRVFDFQYEMRQGKLLLKNDINNWVGIRCDSLCCDIMKDIKDGFDVEVDFPKMPIYNDTISSFDISSSKYVEDIIIGEPKLEIYKNQSKAPFLELNGAVFSIDDLEPWINMQREGFLIANNNEVIYRIIADRLTELEDLRKVIVKLNSFGIDNIYVTFLSKESNKKKVIFKYIHTNHLNLKSDGNLSDLIF